MKRVFNPYNSHIFFKLIDQLPVQLSGLSGFLIIHRCGPKVSSEEAKSDFITYTLKEFLTSASDIPPFPKAPSSLQLP